MAECTPVNHAPTTTPCSTPERYRVSLVKGEHHWHFQWEPGAEATLINSVAELARNSDMPFDWMDAAVVCRHIAQPFGPSRRSNANS